MDLYKRAKISQAMQFNHQNAKANNSEESVEGKVVKKRKGRAKKKWPHK